MNGEAIDIPHQMSALVDQLCGPSGPASRFDVDGRRVEFDGIVELLVRERTQGLDAQTATTVAGIVAAGCFGDQHLWRDLGLSDRLQLRALFETYFEPFAARNDRDMRWKKYIYRRLCRWEGFDACPFPTCTECPSFAECFSPED